MLVVRGGFAVVLWVRFMVVVVEGWHGGGDG